MSLPRQLPLELPTMAAMGAADFILSDSNRAAAGFVQSWPDWPERILAIHGPSGCGKTHLAHVWQKAAAARFIEADFDLASLGAGARLILDELPLLAETTLFHLLNRQKNEPGGYLLILSRQAPARWRVALPDLASRLAALPAVAVAPPDDVLLAAVLAKHFADRQVEVNAEVIGYLVRQMERSFAAAGRVAERLDRAALASGRAITLKLARESLGLD